MMNTNNVKYLLPLALLMLPSGCLGPNPLLEQCGQSWVITAEDASGEDAVGDLVFIREDGEWTEGRLCLTEAQAAKVHDPESVEYKALRSAALSACQAQAADLELVSENCEESLGEPEKDGNCMLEDGECGSSSESGETGETGDANDGFDNPTALIDCNGDLCEVQQALIEQVLRADAATFDADGTTLAPHTAATGEQDGWEFGGIVPGNLGDALGFQNGDVVTEVGGEPFDSWNAVIDAANAALHADVVEVVFIRDHHVVTRRYARI